MNESIPYIGICDFTSRDQVVLMLEVLNSHVGRPINLMVGTMASFKTIHGQPSKWSKIFPPASSLSSIFSVFDESVVNCIHYADYDNNPNLAKTLEFLIHSCGPYLNMVQLDMVWPDPRELEKVKNEFPVEFVLQVNSRSMSIFDNNHERLAMKIYKEYGGIISYALLDCSMGKGVPIDVLNIEKYIQALKAYVPDVEIAVAGGLDHKSVKSVEDLIKKYRVSIDAQSGLRKSRNAMDPIDWDLARKYLKNSLALYG